MEYKEFFDWNTKEARAKYIKTIVGFANCRGGILVFGVDDKPRRVVGLRDKTFRETDESEIERILLENFDVRISFYKEECTISKKFLGVLVISESKEKPIICKKNSIDDILLESSIYYRYNSITDFIKYNDLKNIIEEQKESRVKNILDGIDQVVKYDGKGKISIQSDDSINGTAVTLSNNPNAPSVRISDENLRENYPYTYQDLINRCNNRYKDFNISEKFHKIKKGCWNNPKYCHIRRMNLWKNRDFDPKFYSENIFEVFDKHYKKSKKRKR